MNDEAQEARPGPGAAVCKSGDGEVRVEARFDRETIWLTRRQIAEVFGTAPQEFLMQR